ncbi:MAG: hypothetical protein HQK57_13025 [Deltaproteobacteria bacterium]|nr:hypothetical protein [Deltaproteobacteria bacterium]
MVGEISRAAIRGHAVRPVVWSIVLGMTYEAYWQEAPACYIGQSSHPVWFGPRVGVGLPPGYAGTDIIRRLDLSDARPGLDKLFDQRQPDPVKAGPLLDNPEIVDLTN